MSVLAQGWRIAFLTAGAPVLGSVLLLAIARLTGARWTGFTGPARLATTLAFAIGAALTGLATAPAPDHLRLWEAPVAVTARGIAAGLLIAWASHRLRRGGQATTAAIVLTGWAVLATPIAADLALGQEPGHPVSAIGMMLTASAIAGAGAWLLVSGAGDERTRADWSRLAVAGALGLCYLAFMDYLIVWFGNLPARVGFYQDREAPALVWAAMLLGVAGPLLLLPLGARRTGGGAMLAGLFLFDCWWVGGGVLAMLLAAVLVGLAGIGLVRLGQPEVRDG